MKTEKKCPVVYPEGDEIKDVKGRRERVHSRKSIAAVRCKFHLNPWVHLAEISEPARWLPEGKS